MKTRALILLALVLLVGGGYIWFVGKDSKPASRPAVSQAEKPVKAEGAGGNRQDNAEQDPDCGNALELYSGPELLWRKGADEVSAMPEAKALEESHQSETRALNLLAIGKMAPDVTIVEVVTCDGAIARFPIDKLEKDNERFYVGANRRGAFKLIEFFDGTEHTIMRNISQIILKPGGQRRTGTEADPT
jgi:hypothetical protein